MEQIVFPVPNICEFLTQESKLRVYYTTERDEQGSKINDFFLRSEDLFNEMNWQKKLRGTQEATGNTNTVPCASFSSTLYLLVPVLHAFSYISPGPYELPLSRLETPTPFPMFTLLCIGIISDPETKFPFKTGNSPSSSSTFVLWKKKAITLSTIKETQEISAGNISTVFLFLPLDDQLWFKTQTHGPCQSKLQILHKQKHTQRLY